MEGRIIKVLSGVYTIKDFNTSEVVSAKARGKFRSMTLDKDSSFNKKTSFKNKIETKTVKVSPKVGDYVTYSFDQGSYVIDDIKPRFNDLIRPLIANVDQVVLIFAAKRPDFDPYLLDQFLVLMEERNVKVTIVITKKDLLDENEYKELEKIMSYYKSIGYDYYFVNSKANDGIDAVKPIFKGKVSVLSGQTGAGKSKFINALIPGFELKTQDISEALNRGKHTTRASELYDFMDGLVGDTPGFSKLEFDLLDEKDLQKYFVEFKDHSCKYQDCMHINEPGCKIKSLVDSGEILKSRYDNYVKFYTELKNIKRKY